MGTNSIPDGDVGLGYLLVRLEYKSSVVQRSISVVVRYYDVSISSLELPTAKSGYR
jgi:hypothetical protein